MPFFRRKTPVWPALLPLVFALLFMAAAYTLYQPLWERAFRSDDSPVSWLSSVLLFANAALALRLAMERALPPRLGGLMSLGLLWCALDEQFMFHERFKFRVIDPRFGLEAFPGSWLAQLPLAAVVLGGAACILMFLLHARSRSPAAALFMLAALAVGIFSQVVDVAGEAWGIAPFEEGLEVLAESLFLGGLLSVRGDRG